MLLCPPAVAMEEWWIALVTVLGIVPRVAELFLVYRVGRAERTTR